MRTVTTSTLLAVAVAAASLLATPGPATAGGGARVHVVHGLPGATVDVAVDGRVIAGDVAGPGVVGPFDLAAGEHVLEVTDASGAAVVSSTLQLDPGSDSDVVVHPPVTAGAGPVVTVFANDVSAVPAGKARLVVSHTAAVPPADILVDGQVLFANVANGESLTAVVPVGTYRVQVVATGRTSPSFLGPLDLTVQAGALNRVFAVGDPAGTGMDAVVHVLAVPTSGTPAPGRVETGTGGQAAGIEPVGAGWFGRSG